MQSPKVSEDKPKPKLKGNITYIILLYFRGLFKTSVEQGGTDPLQVGRHHGLHERRLPGTTMFRSPVRPLHLSTLSYKGHPGDNN